jgi:hypothetical protein
MEEKNFKEENPLAKFKIPKKAKIEAKVEPKPLPKLEKTSDILKKASVSEYSNIPTPKTLRKMEISGTEIKEKPRKKPKIIE